MIQSRCPFPPARASLPRCPVAFTLLELLIVIAVVGILTSVIIPVIGQVRESASLSKCSSNLRQTTIAYLLNATENDGTLYPAYDPNSPHRRWTLMMTGYNTSGNVIAPNYVPTVNATFKDDSLVMGCDAHRELLQLRSSAPTFSCNRNLATGENQPWKKLSEIEYPSRAMIFSDGTGSDGKISTILNNGQVPGYGDPHGGKINVAFADGHVESRDLADFPQATSMDREARLLWFGRF